MTTRQSVTRHPAASHSLCFRFKLIVSVAVDITCLLTAKHLYAYPLRRDRAHIVRVNIMTDAHGLCLPGQHPDRNQRERDRSRNNRTSGLGCTPGPAGARRQVHATTSGLYGACSHNYAVEWKLGRILPIGWHADAGADNILLRTSAAATYFSRWHPAVVLLTATAPRSSHREGPP